MAVKLPSIISVFHQAVERTDFAALEAILADDAVVVHEGKEIVRDNLRSWFEGCAQGGRTSLRPLDVSKKNNGATLTAVFHDVGRSNELNRAVEMECRFLLTGGKVASLHVERRNLPAMPACVEAYICATNSSDLEALVASFAEDSMVNDQFRDYWGKQAIGEWSARDIIGAELTMFVTNVVQHHGHTVVTANVEGNFDARGLPEPFVLAFYFSSTDNEIVQLLILRNQV
ncbi:nuclear transport factor 2 family protein [Rhizobium sp. BK251]|uniref:nuclear transport factor 2 family protein n=1 Tax=Rhizobium sp. BK251 TaxID=2512125 RepID=UPI00104FD234|nr:nuclear transport factor 2 family protein [Rhizobium sp. BK251]TCL72249.1 uncharacterized protein DUF4440 [Rhizobium sp. BK251]